MLQITGRLKLLYLCILSSFGGMTQNKSIVNEKTFNNMNSEKETFEKSIYALIGLPIESLDSLENNFVYPGVVHGINGTCFFISPNKFVTAYHVLNKVYAAKQKYFLINKYGDIISGVKIELEVPENDLCVGKIDTSVDTFYNIPTSSPTLRQGETCIAYGYSYKDTENFHIKILKENSTVQLIEHDILELKKIEYKFIGQQMLENSFSKDEIPINLKNCNVLLFDTSLELGFSGGPTFHNGKNEVIGFSSQDAYDENGNLSMMVVPIIEN